MNLFVSSGKRVGNRVGPYSLPCTYLVASIASRVSRSSLEGVSPLFSPMKTETNLVPEMLCSFIVIFVTLYDRRSPEVK